MKDIRVMTVDQSGETINEQTLIPVINETMKAAIRRHFRGETIMEIERLPVNCASGRPFFRVRLELAA
jgi:hypothetical protein